MNGSIKTPSFSLRFPDDMRPWLEQQAAVNRRSLNSEILIRLEESRRLQEQKEAGGAK